MSKTNSTDGVIADIRALPHEVALAKEGWTLPLPGGAKERSY
jgi:hypothetical protein